ncbi:MAG: ABC transporter permease, partial [Kiloniellales bacterium]|nr:ABC transporter permease [Kiloniellales bacterium]
MNWKKLTLGAAAAAMMAVPLAEAAELTIPSMVYRTGPYAPNGIPFANGYADWWTLLNERDG